MVLTEFFTLSEGLANRPFCPLDILRAQLKSNLTVGERLLASDQEAVTEWRLILLKGQWTFFNNSFQNLFICKKNSVMEFLANTDGAHEILQAVRWPCKPIILSIGHFESPIEVQPNSWWKTTSLWWRSSYIMQANFT